MTTQGLNHRLMKSFEAIVGDYNQRFRENAICEMRFYEKQPNLEEVVKLAGRAIVCGRKHRHQWHLTNEALNRATRALLSRRGEFERCKKDFDDLLTLVEAATLHVKGVNEMYWYDTALRIGAFLGTAPERVYLHRGTREGAVALGFEGTRTSLAMSDLPSAFASLTAREAEDCLCIYKTDLRNLARGVPLGNLAKTKGCVYGQPKRGC